MNYELLNYVSATYKLVQHDRSAFNCMSPTKNILYFDQWINDCDCINGLEIPFWAGLVLQTTQTISYWAGNWQINHSNYGMGWEERCSCYRTNIITNTNLGKSNISQLSKDINMKINRFHLVMTLMVRLSQLGK